VSWRDRPGESDGLLPVPGDDELEAVSFAALHRLAELQAELQAHGMTFSAGDMDLRLCLVLNWALRSLAEERRRSEALMASLARAMSQCDDAWRRYYRLRLAEGTGIDIADGTGNALAH